MSYLSVVPPHVKAVVTEDGRAVIDVVDCELDGGHDAPSESGLGNLASVREEARDVDVMAFGETSGTLTQTEDDRAEHKHREHAISLPHAGPRRPLEVHLPLMPPPPPAPPLNRISAAPCKHTDKQPPSLPCTTCHIPGWARYRDLIAKKKAPPATD